MYIINMMLYIIKFLFPVVSTYEVNNMLHPASVDRTQLLLNVMPPLPKKTTRSVMDGITAVKSLKQSYEVFTKCVRNDVYYLYTFGSA